MSTEKLRRIERLLREYFSGGLPEDISRDIRSWYAGHADEEEVHEALRRVFFSLPEADLDQDRIERIFDAVHEKIDAAPVQINKPVRKSGSLWRRSLVFRVAAVVVPAAIVLGAYLFSINTVYINPEFRPEGTAGENMTVIGAVSGQRYIVMPDSSRIWLNDGSEIAYGEDFMEKREVTLRGEAFFSVKRNMGAPFSVHTEDLTVEVLGTEFNVRENVAGKTTVVVLVRGSVRITNLEKHGDVILEPGQHLVSGVKGKEVIIEECVTSDHCGWRGISLIFYDAPLGEVLDRVASYFGYGISVDPSLDTGARITIDAGFSDMGHIMESLSRITNSGFTYEVDQDTIRINAY